MAKPNESDAIFKNEGRISIVVNSIGALLAFIYLEFIDPAPIAQTPIQQLDTTASIIFFAILGAVLFIGLNWGNRHKKEFRHWISLIESGQKTPDDVPEKIKRNMLNFPVIAAGIGAMMWLIASCIAGYATQSSRVFFGLMGWGGIVSVILHFFVNDLLWRPVIPAFFPDGNLSKVHAFRLSILGKLLIVLLFTGIIPPTMLSILTWQRAEWLLTASNPETVLENLHLIQIFIPLVSIGASIGLAFFITRGITKSLTELRIAMNHVQNNDLDTKVLVTTNDELGELGEHFNQMTAELRQKEILFNTNIQLREQLVKIQELENALREQTIRDPLTGLFNRRYLEEMLEKEIAKAKRRNKLLSVVLIDLDNLKALNDQFGHVQGGDEALKLLAAKVGGLCREEDIFCRFAGDEFMAIMYDTNAQVALKRACEWKEALSKETVYIGDDGFSVTFSAGIAEYPTHGSEAVYLVQRADKALYRVKETGRNNAMIYSAEMNKV